MAVVVDTDVVSFIFKGDTRGALYQPHLQGKFLILSFMSLAELHCWTLASNWGTRRKAELATHLHRYSIRHSTPELCKLWAQVTDNGRRTGRKIAPADAWIAATALYLNVPLVTHNASDFVAVPGLQIITEHL